MRIFFNDQIHFAYQLEESDFYFHSIKSFKNYIKKNTRRGIRKLSLDFDRQSYNY